MIAEGLVLLRKLQKGNKLKSYDLPYLSPRMQIDLIRCVVAELYMLSLIDEPTAGRLVHRLPTFLRGVIDWRWNKMMAVALEVQEESNAALKRVGLQPDTFFEETVE